MTEPLEQYVWWDEDGILTIGHTAGEQDALIHHKFPEPGGRGHQIAVDCHCDPTLVEVRERFEVWCHHLLERR